MFSLIMLAFVLLDSSRLYAQFRTGLQISALIPTGELEAQTEVGYGGVFNASYYPFTTDFEFTFSASFFRAGLKENLPDYDLDVDFIPVVVGVRYNFGDVNVIPFAGIEGGVYFSKYDLLIKSRLLGNSSTTTKDQGFGYAPYIGLRMNLSEALDFEVTAKYNTVITPYVGRGYVNILSGITSRL